MKRGFIVIALIALVGAGAFAQLAIGATGAIYTDMTAAQEDPQSVVDGFANGEGIFYGPFVELGMGKLAVGASGSFSFYQEDWSFDQSGDPAYLMDMMDYDITAYAQFHLFKYKAFLDPFVEAGVGMMAKDYQETETTTDPDPENPISGTMYWEAGAGLGINLGGLGVFVKGLYMQPISSVPGTYIYYDEYGNEYEGEYDLADYPMQNLKVIAGVKLIL